MVAAVLMVEVVLALATAAADDVASCAVAAAPPAEVLQLRRAPPL